MSQFFVGAAASVLPPTVPTSFPTDEANDSGVITSPGLVIPDANQVFVLGNSSEENNISGIVTIAVPNNSENLEITLTNRIISNELTTDDTPINLVDFTMPLEGVYSFESTISAYNETDVLGASYKVFVGVRSTGGTAFKLGLEDEIVNEEGAMSACEVDSSVSVNNYVLSVTGIAGKTIRWQALTIYHYGAAP